MTHKIFSYSKKHFSKIYIETVIFIFANILFLSFASRSIITGDTPEFIAAASVGGVVHAPGYPLYSLLTHILASIPFGELAWKINGFSGIISSITLIIVYWIIKRITKSSLAGVAAVFFLLVNEIFLLYSLVAEVHALQILLLSLYVLFALCFYQTGKLSYVYFTALIITLGFAHSPSIIFTLPSFLLLLWIKRRLISIKHILLLAPIFLCGFLFYLYIWFGASQNPVMNWGRIHDVSSLVTFVLRQDFGTFNLNTTSVTYPFQYSSFVYFVELLLTDAWYLLPLAAYGAIYSYSKNKFFISSIVSLLLLNGPIFYALMNVPVLNVMHRANVEQYFGYSYVFLVILSGFGFAMLLHKLSTYKNILLVVILPILLLIAINTFGITRQDSKSIVIDTITNQFQQLPKDAIVITCADSIQMPSYYYQYALKNRSDVTILNFCLLQGQWYQENLRTSNMLLKRYITNNGLAYEKMCKELAPQHKLYLYPWFPEFSKAFPGCVVIPHGLVNEIVPKKNMDSLSTIKKMNDSLWQEFMQKTSLASLKLSDMRTREALYYLSEQRNFLGLFYLENQKIDWAITEFKNSRDLSDDASNGLANEAAIYFKQGKNQQALELAKRGLGRESANASLYKELGAIYMQSRDYSKASENFKMYLEFQPTDTDVPKIKTLIDQLDRAEKTL